MATHMVELELVGIHEDGEHLVFTDANNTTYRVPITEPLRAAVRRDRPHMEHLRAPALRPRDIQALIRAGATAEEVAEEADVSVDSVRRYEGPVLAERQFVAQRAQAIRIGRGDDAPTLGDLVIDRLAARNVSDISWDASRAENQPWQVFATYQAGKQELTASWEVDITAGTFSALDDEARWLSEIDLADSPYRHLNAVEDPFYDVETDGDIQQEKETVTDESETDVILDELQAARGVRQPLESLHTEPTLWDEPPAAHPPHSRPQDATDATVLKLPEADSEPEDTPVETKSSDTPERRKRSRRGRTSVPSWDEIVFGAKND